MCQLVGRILRWTLGVVGATAVLGAVLYLHAAHQPRGLVTVDEVIAPGEDAAIMRLVRAATESLDKRAKDDHLYRRDVHFEPHGCVKAELEVDPGIGDRYRHGVFAAPGRRYRAWVRFSNATQTDDRQPDGRGMAIKLMNVPGPKLLPPKDDPEQGTQDFVMVDYHTFFLRNLADYEEFFPYQVANRPVAYFFAGWPWSWKLHALYHGARALLQRVSSPLAARYYSMSAYRLGPENVKFSVQPCVMPKTPVPVPRTAHYLRDALVRDLQGAAACFRFLVQLQEPTRNMPIEDPSIQWDEDESPYVPVATLTIPVQEFSSDLQNRFCEQLSFAPWHALPEHRPVGALNRARLAVYREVSRRRHARNDVPRGEPQGWCLDLSGAPCPAEDSP
jgi:hypothetical protein